MYRCVKVLLGVAVCIGKMLGVAVCIGKVARRCGMYRQGCCIGGCKGML